MNIINEQSIALKRNKLLIVNTEKINPADDLNLAKKIKVFTNILDSNGYRLSSDVLTYLNNEEIDRLYFSLDKIFSETGDLLTSYKTLYKGFPEQVILKSDEELKIDQLTVYSGNIEKFEKDNSWYEDSDESKLESDKIILGRMTLDEFFEIPNNIVKSSNSINNNSTEELNWFLDNYIDKVDVSNIKFKEILCIVLKKYFEKNKELKINLEINDALRFTFYEMGINPSLKNTPRYLLVNIKRPVRRYICGIIDNIVKRKGLESVILDSKKFRKLWNMVSERLHPGDYMKYYPDCWNFFSSVKQKGIYKKYRTFNSIIQKMYDNGSSIEEISKKLLERPGEFLRKFDSLHRRALDERKESILVDELMDTPINNKLLIELSQYYDRRNENTKRVIYLNGRETILPSLKKYSDDIIETLQGIISRKIFLNIKESIKEQDLIGKTVYIDPELKSIPIPRNMRNSSFDFPSETRFKIPKDKNIIRFFVFWEQNTEVCEDLDLHAFLMGKELNKYNSIGWNTCLKSENRCALHSGDVLNRPGKCAEFIDVDIDSCIKSGYSYIVSSVFNFKGRPLNTLPCYLGYCYRNKMISTQVLDWYPDSDVDKRKNTNKVESLVPITSEYTSIEAFLVDLENRDIIIINGGFNGVLSNSDRRDCEEFKRRLVSYYTTKKYITSFDILKYYYIARGANVVTELPEIKTDEGEIQDDIYEKVTKEDILKDYTKVLSIL